MNSRVARYWNVSNITPMKIETVDQAFEFISRYGNVSSSVEELQATTPTRAALRSVRDRCYAEVDRAIRLVAEYHGVENPD